MFLESILTDSRGSHVGDFTEAFFTHTFANRFVDFCSVAFGAHAAEFDFVFGTAR